MSNSKQKVTVVYRGETYQVLAEKYLGDSDLYKLASRHSLGAPFAASKKYCTVLGYEATGFDKNGRQIRMYIPAK